MGVLIDENGEELRDEDDAEPAELQWKDERERIMSLALRHDTDPLTPLTWDWIYHYLSEPAPRSIPVDDPALIAAIEALRRGSDWLTGLALGSTRPRTPIEQRDELEAALAALRARLDGAA